MKKTVLILVFSLFVIPLFAQQPELGLPGDNLNLYGVLNIFQNSPTLEEFEKHLNNPDSKVNNLDLNGDGQIDYLHVIDNVNGAVHDIVLRDDINENETQDVAVIEVERDANNHVHIQIIGDEALYGKDYIVEPQVNTPNPGYHGNAVVERPYYAPRDLGNNRVYVRTNVRRLEFTLALGLLPASLASLGPGKPFRLLWISPSLLYLLQEKLYVCQPRSA